MLTVRQWHFLIRRKLISLIQYKVKLSQSLLVRFSQLPYLLFCKYDTQSTRAKHAALPPVPIKRTIRVEWYNKYCLPVHGGFLVHKRALEILSSFSHGFPEVNWAGFSASALLTTWTCLLCWNVARAALLWKVPAIGISSCVYLAWGHQSRWHTCALAIYCVLWLHWS